MRWPTPFRAAPGRIWKCPPRRPACGRRASGPKVIKSVDNKRKRDKGDTMRKAIFGFCCLAALQFIAVAAMAQQAVKVGLIMTYTGQFADAAAQMDNGITLYMKQHGDTVAGKKIEIIRKDDGGAPDV